jgi:hypothetical protein
MPYFDGPSALCTPIPHKTINGRMPPVGFSQSATVPALMRNTSTIDRDDDRAFAQAIGYNADQRQQHQRQGEDDKGERGLRLCSFHRRAGASAVVCRMASGQPRVGRCR